MNILTSISSFFKYPFQNQSNNDSHLQSQPHDIIELIISKLSFTDQLNMRQVSTEMKNRFHAIPTARRTLFCRQYTKLRFYNINTAAQEYSMILIQLLEKERFPEIDTKEILSASRRLLDRKIWEKKDRTDLSRLTIFVVESAREIYDRIIQQ